MDRRTIPATLIPGDGIGPEIMGAVCKVLEAIEAPFEFETCQGGLAAIQKTGDPLPQATLESIRRTGLAPKGPALTDREREILGLIAQGHPNGVIANQLALSPKTVANYVSNLFSKLQVPDRAQAIIRAREAGMGH